MLLKNIVNNLIKGLKIDSYVIFSDNPARGRFKEESDLNIFIKNKNFTDNLFHLKFYMGIKPYYHPWIEVTNINKTINLDKKIKYFDSEIEVFMLKLVSNYISNGEKVYIEYSNDIETSFGLTYNFPPAITRLGNKLFKLDFTWFKDWYFPEGGNEGGQKLQGEKPLDGQSKNRHLKKIKLEINNFLNENNKFDKNNNFYTNAVSRGKNVLRKML